MFPLNVVRHDNVRPNTDIKNNFRISHFSSPSIDKYGNHLRLTPVGEENVDYSKNVNRSFYKHVTMLPPRPVFPNSTVNAPRQNHTRIIHPPHVEETLTDIPLQEEIKIDLNLVSKSRDRTGIDFPPFFKVYDYECRFDEDDIIPLTINNDPNCRKKRMRFSKELEYKDLKKFVKRKDYILYYLFGFDRTGFFGILKERESFYNFPIKHFIEPLHQEEDHGFYFEEFEDSDSDLEDANCSKIDFFDV
ncbi:similar to Saccharomyces cerevisiae YER180C ISC10 Protein required for sporulation [Maudiozyma barnettii]|uniref:Similar to Saccharomyces cerevisiae YER180C ISC10 Protein required for sporulation n=1 Tax=Maudiozyma barnettii TaxID=61262 RepID=A0A8H2VGZ8_9SACH|nr:Isc10p [Kazachstania barnettii]CAB4255491.1 similar to Saccharomyces cerevisiae YER180C ISC10 Protein required for sporulation [Kazachstania barnettii]CAD1783985.1 similar to Saccharomyces cerevisiae YER180C ISC10 Protein required for sporulation [Kazachstania barnettii]